MIICVDFDGTVVDHMFPEVGQPVPGALDWIRIWQKAGAQIILWTVRSNQSPHMQGTWENSNDPPRAYLDEAVKYMTDNNIELLGANENPTQKSWSNSPKAYAPVYVDDAAYGCPLINLSGFNRPCVDWNVVGPAILDMIHGN